MAFTLATSMDNTIAALGLSNCVCQVDLWLADWQWEIVLAAMQVPFPELTYLHLSLHPYGKTLSVIPDSLLDGSAPRLRYFGCNIPFMGLPKLLLSATHLVNLALFNIPHSGYFLPEAMVALLCALSSLERLSLAFRSPQSRPDRASRSLPPSKRSIFPSFRELYFSGVTEYLEELVTRIDTPQLDYMEIYFFHQIDFDCPQLAQFINHTPTLRACDKALVQFFYSETSVALLARSWLRILEIGISCREPQQPELSSVAQVCHSSIHSLSFVENLYIKHICWRRVSKIDAIESTLWLQLLLPFTAVKNLYLREIFAPGIAAALQELVGGRITEVLPSLQNIFVEGFEPSRSFQDNIRQFVAVRQLSDHPIVISVWERESM